MKHKQQTRKKILNYQLLKILIFQKEMLICQKIKIFVALHMIEDRPLKIKKIQNSKNIHHNNISTIKQLINPKIKRKIKNKMKNFLIKEEDNKLLK